MSAAFCVPISGNVLAFSLGSCPSVVRTWARVRPFHTAPASLQTRDNLTWPNPNVDFYRAQSYRLDGLTRFDGRLADRFVPVFVRPFEHARAKTTGKRPVATTRSSEQTKRAAAAYRRGNVVRLRKRRATTLNRFERVKLSSHALLREKFYCRLHVVIPIEKRLFQRPQTVIFACSQNNKLVKYECVRFLHCSRTINIHAKWNSDTNVELYWHSLDTIEYKFNF